MDGLLSDPNQDSSPKLVYLYPDHEKCLGRVPSLSKVDGVEPNELEVLNSWFAKEWKNVYKSSFSMSERLAKSFTDFLESNSTIAIDFEKAEGYLETQKLLYNGVRRELQESENVSQCKQFHKYYYSSRENPTSLNNPVVLSNIMWSLKTYKSDEFALTCLVDVLLQSYMVALDYFISLGGVEIIRDTIEYMAKNDKLKKSTNFLMKCMDLLDKLHINFKVLQTSKIGISVNCIAQAKVNAKAKTDYECSNDKVKLKATNLIKKWKAIRDASMPTKVSIEVEKKQTTEKKVEKSHSTESTGANEKEKEGSFLLNIINNMVEQKEREKKRKLELRNSQMSTKYKSKSEDNEERGPQEKEEKISKTKVKEKEEEGQKDEDKKEETKSSTVQLESLMNFFKEYSSKNEDKGSSEQPVSSNQEEGEEESKTGRVNVKKQNVNDQKSVAQKVKGSYQNVPAQYEQPEMGSYGQGDYRAMYGENPNRYMNPPVMGQVLPPGFIPPPPPPPPAPPMYTNMQEKQPHNIKFNTNLNKYQGNNTMPQGIHQDKREKYYRRDLEDGEGGPTPPWK